ncbi:hypothetical protein WAI453_005193 [Rhynchosporium graminicola]
MDRFSQPSTSNDIRLNASHSTFPKYTAELYNRTPSKGLSAIMAAGKHPVTLPRVRPFYRFAATGLGASMWFFLMYRAKKDGADASPRFDSLS